MYALCGEMWKSIAHGFIVIVIGWLGLGLDGLKMSNESWPALLLISKRTFYGIRDVC